VTEPLARVRVSAFPVRIVLIPLMACFTAGCGRLVSLHGLHGVDYHIQEGNRTEQELFEAGPHAIRHVIVSKPAGDGWKTTFNQDRTEVGYWKDLGRDHTKSAKVAWIYRFDLKDQQELLERSQRTLVFMWQREGDVLSQEIFQDPGTTKNCILFNGRFASKKYGLVTTTGMVCPLNVYPSHAYYIGFSEAWKVPIDEAALRTEALRFAKGVVKKGPMQLPLLD
jgi:hypothetical protein